MTFPSDSSGRRLMDERPRPDLVVIGASAGGVEAVGAILAELPSNMDAAVAIVLHMPPSKPSLLAELFSARCARPVKEAEDKEPLKPGTVYIAPPNYHLLIEPDASFALSVEDAVLFSRPSINLLFESAAYVYGGRMLGIILTGASSDGAQGLSHVRDHGGSAWIQDPASAKARAMPAAALATAGADRILELPELAAELSRILS